jgi:hypothetical protein
MSWTITPALKHPAAAVTDPDARTYLLAVEQADGQFLESGVATAINTFVTGCKTDGIWTAIKASCILAGARTLAGALVPLAGTAPTNFNFVSGDYNRKTGLVGNGSTKYLDSNRNNNADPQNSQHFAVRISAMSVGFVVIGAGPDVTGSSMMGNNNGGGSAFFRSRTEVAISITPVIAYSNGFLGKSRSGSSAGTVRNNANQRTFSSTSETPYNGNIFVFANNGGGVVSAASNARIAFYSIGESLDLAKLDARVTDLINAFDTAIPS